ncbi:hypothetical protein BC834DRAFT_88406 [Gloeopeniophorella convolvens]|nr:hypothetical protein BC834DRAFT_88406 [Gloeopeniophorella convolvens]
MPSLESHRQPPGHCGVVSLCCTIEIAYPTSFDGEFGHTCQNARGDRTTHTPGSTLSGVGTGVSSAAVEWGRLGLLMYRVSYGRFLGCFCQSRRYAGCRGTRLRSQTTMHRSHSNFEPAQYCTPRAIENAPKVWGTSSATILQPMYSTCLYMFPTIMRGGPVMERTFPLVHIITEGSGWRSLTVESLGDQSPLVLLPLRFALVVFPLCGCGTQRNIVCFDSWVAFNAVMHEQCASRVKHPPCSHICYHSFNASSSHTLPPSSSR